MTIEVEVTQEIIDEATKNQGKDDYDVCQECVVAVALVKAGLARRDPEDSFSFSVMNSLVRIDNVYYEPDEETKRRIRWFDMREELDPWVIKLDKFDYTDYD